MTQRPTLTALGTNGQITLDEYNNRAMGSSRYLQELFAGTNSDKIAGLGVDALPMAGRNMLANGGFESWFRGVSFTSPDTATWTKAADCWRVLNGTMGTAGGLDSAGNFSASIVSPSGNTQIQQRLFGVERYWGKTITLTGRAQNGANSAMQAFLYDNLGGGGPSQYYPLVGGVTRSIATGYTVTPGATAVYAGFTFPYAGTYSIDHAMLTPTLGPVAYQPDPPAIERRKIQQYLVQRRINVKWRVQNTNEPISVYVPFPAPLVEAPILVTPFVDQADVYRIFSGSPGTDEIDINEGATGVAQIDQDGMTVQVCSYITTPPTMVTLFNFTIVVDCLDG